MGFIRVANNGWGFVDAASGAPFVPVGSNYCAVIDATGFPLFGSDAYTEADGVAEARRAFARLADLGLNVVRTWLEPDVFFPIGRRLDPAAAGKLDALLNCAREHGIRLSLGAHLCPLNSRGFRAGTIRGFEPPHRERLNEMLYLLGQRWGQDETIFSWSIIGEGSLPWQTPWLAEGWPTWLSYWYDSDITTLRAAWEGVAVPGFAEAPIPPRNVGFTLPLGAVSPGRLHELPAEPQAGSTWRYDWRLYLEEVGASWVLEQLRTLRAAGARQMLTVGNNSWIFPGLAAGQMAVGFNPYFYLDAVDYLCQHNYPAPQCLPGGNGDPLDSDEAMTFWRHAVEVMARIYGSMGKPVVLEEWGWYGGSASRFLCPLPYRSEEEQRRYCDLMMETSVSCYAGWFYWQWRDMPQAPDISDYSALYAADGTRVKPWGKCYAQWAERLKQHPPQRAAAAAHVALPMKSLYTDDRFHETWWQETCRDYSANGPLDFDACFELKPIMTNSSAAEVASPPATDAQGQPAEMPQHQWIS